MSSISLLPYERCIQLSLGSFSGTRVKRALISFLVSACAVVALPAVNAHAVSDRHYFTVNTSDFPPTSFAFIVDHSIEIWNRETNTRVWRAEGKQLSTSRGRFTYTYTYRGGNEYLKLLVHAKGGAWGTISDLNIRCDYEAVVGRQIRYATTRCF